MNRKNIDVSGGKITPIENRNIGGVFLALTLDTRYPRADYSYPIAVRVIYLRKIWYYQTAAEAGTESIHFIPGTTQVKPEIRDIFK